MAANPLRTDDFKPFSTYRRLSIDRKGFDTRSPEISPTLEHFFQSERFRGTNELLRREILEASSAMTARKCAKRHEAEQRKDWIFVQDRVMAAAIGMKIREHPMYARNLILNPELIDKAYSFRDTYWSNDRPGISMNRYAHVLRQVRKLRIPRKPSTHNDLKPSTCSSRKPSTDNNACRHAHPNGLGSVFFYRIWGSPWRAKPGADFPVQHNSFGCTILLQR